MYSHVIFKQKVRRDDGFALVDRRADVAGFPAEPACTHCGLTMQEHNPRSKHSFTAETFDEGYLLNLDIEIPQGPEYDSLTGAKLSPEIQVHRRDRVARGNGPNQWSPPEGG